jgi:glycosyltransferase involved in cell wall biosynthesis
MKILFLNSDAELYGNGADKILLLTTNALADFYDIEVLLPYSGPLVEAINKSGIQCKVMPYAVLRRNTASPLRLILYTIKLIKSSYSLYRYIKKNNIDLVYSNTSCILQGLILSSLGLTRHIWHIHEIIDEPKYAKVIFSLLFSRDADIILCVSTAVKKHININSNRLLVVWNGIPPITHEPVVFKRTGTPTVLLLGRFNRVKGQQQLVRSVKLLKDGPLKKTQFTVRLTGGIYGEDDSYLNSTRELIHKLNLEDTIIIEECVKDISTICRFSNILVIPSEQPDSFPTVALEAMSIGTPVMGYWQGGLPEILNFDTQCLAQFNNHIDLAEKLLPFLCNEEFRVSKAQQQHKRYKTLFTYNHFKLRLHSVINSLTSISNRYHHHSTYKAETYKKHKANSSRHL